MHKFIILLYCSVLCTLCAAQTSVSNISFAYDNKGNRIGRVINLVQLKSARVDTDSLNTWDNPIFSDSLINNKTQATPPKDADYFTEFLGKTEIRIFPNPTRGRMVVNIGSASTDKPGNIWLFDFNGRTIIQKRISEPNTGIDIINYPAGTYIMKVMIDGQTSEWKIIKQ